MLTNTTLKELFEKVKTLNVATASCCSGWLVLMTSLTASKEGQFVSSIALLLFSYYLAIVLPENGRLKCVGQFDTNSRTFTVSLDFIFMRLCFMIFLNVVVIKIKIKKRSISVKTKNVCFS